MCHFPPSLCGGGAEPAFQAWRVLIIKGTWGLKWVCRAGNAQHQSRYDWGGNKNTLALKCILQKPVTASGTPPLWLAADFKPLTEITSIFVKILFTKPLLTINVSAHTGLSSYLYLRPLYHPHLFLNKDTAKTLGCWHPERQCSFSTLVNFSIWENER